MKKSYKTLSENLLNGNEFNLLCDLSNGGWNERLNRTDDKMVESMLLSIDYACEEKPYIFQNWEVEQKQFIDKMASFKMEQLCQIRNDVELFWTKKLPIKNTFSPN